jgi:hypothetical protein
MTLRGWPQIQEGTQVQVATEPSTYFVIKANGQFQALGGRSRTDIVRDGPKKASLAPTANPASPPAPAGNKAQGGQQ